MVHWPWNKQRCLYAKKMFSKIFWIPWYTRSTPRLWGTLPNLCSLYRPVSAKLFMEALARTWAAWMGYMGRIRRPLGLVLAYLLGKKNWSSPPAALLSSFSLLHAPCPKANQGLTFESESQLPKCKILWSPWAAFQPVSATKALGRRRLHVVCIPGASLSMDALLPIIPCSLFWFWQQHGVDLQEQSAWQLSNCYW